MKFEIRCGALDSSPSKTTFVVGGRVPRNDGLTVLNDSQLASILRGALEHFFSALEQNQHGNSRMFQGCVKGCSAGTARTV